MRKPHHILFILGLLVTLSLLTSQNGSADQLPLMVILSPAEGSVVNNPISLTAQFQTDEGENMVRASLIDRNGLVLARQLFRLEDSPATIITFSTEVPFEIATENARALVTLTTQDQYQRPIATRGIILDLQQEGPSTILSSPLREPWLTITQPKQQTVIHGEKVSITGSVTPITENPIILELVSQQGRVLGSVQLKVESAGMTFDFNASLSFPAVKNDQGVRLVIRQSDASFGKTIILDSILLMLKP